MTIGKTILSAPGEHMLYSLGLIILIQVRDDWTTGHL